MRLAYCILRTVVVAVFVVVVAVVLIIVVLFLQSYGGIRGAVSFSLALVLSKEHFKQYNLIFTTTITVVMFTVFVQVG